MNAWSRWWLKTAFRAFCLAELLLAQRQCNQEPWGRYSAVGGVYKVNGEEFFYSFSGDTTSDGDLQGGVVRTNWRFSFKTGCWEQLATSVVPVGYRATATLLDDGYVYIFGGAGADYAAVSSFWRYAPVTDEWTQLFLDDGPSARFKHAAVRIATNKLLLSGGRVGSTALSDVWIFDAAAMSWELVGNMLPITRHWMAFDPVRNVTWVYGGLKDSRTRYQSQLWTFDLTSFEFQEITTVGDPPPRMASHAMEYVEELDALLLWGGTCGDDSELYFFDIPKSKWCFLRPANRPDNRDAMIWTLKYPKFYVAGGDIICYNFHVYPIVDVHVWDFTAPDAWEMLYEPYNSRGTGNEAYCTGENKGNCQPTPRLSNTKMQPGTCDSTFLEKFNATTSPEGRNADRGHRASVALNALVTLILSSF